VRFGDPETQVVLPRLTEDLTGLLAEAAAGRLRTEPRFSTDASVCVVLASEGYPVAPRTGDRIDGLEAAAAIEGVSVYHAGTALDDEGCFVTAGGRVLGVSAVGPTIAEARRRAYAAVDRIGWEGMQYRTDIAADAAAVSAGAGAAASAGAGAGAAAGAA
jgi:phosphoribosylamine--glycine ligase